MHQGIRRPVLPVKTQSSRGGHPAATHASSSLNLHIRKRPMRIGLGIRPAACHARHVRRCLPHNAAAVVASTSRGPDSTVRTERRTFAVTMLPPRKGKSATCDIAIWRATRFTRRLTAVTCKFREAVPRWPWESTDSADRNKKNVAT
jgi:hypothetical protein